jgi:hypothetical protein
MKRNVILLICALGVCSCDASQPFRGNPADVTGSWGEDFGSTFVPGNSLMMALQNSGDVVTGTGSYAGEAGPFGALVVSGTAGGDSVHLRIVFVPEATVFPQLKPDTAWLEGAFTTRDRIDATLARGGLPFPFTLVRLHNGDRP